MEIESNSGIDADAKVIVEANRAPGETNTQMTAWSKFYKPPVKQSAFAEL